MNRTDKLAQELFGGDLEQAIYHIMKNFETEALNEYVGEFNREQSNIFLDLLAKEIKKTVPEKERKSIAEKSFYMASLGLTESDLDSIDLNEHKKDIAKRSILLLSVAVAAPCLAYFFPQYRVEIIAVGSLSTACIALPLAHRIINFLQVRKLKKSR